MIKSKQDLKTAFSVGNNPSAQDYKNLIDSLYGSISHIKTSFDDINWEEDEYLATAKALYEEFKDTIELVNSLNERIKGYEETDWESESDVPVADAVNKKIGERIDEIIMEIPNYDIVTELPELITDNRFKLYNGTLWRGLLEGESSLPAGTPRPISEFPVLTEYPETSPELAGTRFWYKGNEWHYMTQAEIDSTGWSGLVEVGFTAPVNKTKSDEIAGLSVNGPIGTFAIGYTDVLDFIGFGRLIFLATQAPLPGGALSVKYTSVRNAHLLSSLEDAGTLLSMSFGSGAYNLSAEAINDLFTQLPPTTKTATIKVDEQPGAATCDPTIATAKGYTVVAS